MDDGILKMVKKSRKRYGFTREDPWTVIGGKKYKADKDGIWYEIDVASIPMDQRYFLPRNIVVFDGVYCTKKRQLNTKEIKKLKLT
jgi:hypothetical protein